MREALRSGVVALDMEAMMDEGEDELSCYYYNGINIRIVIGV